MNSWYKLLDLYIRENIDKLRDLLTLVGVVGLNHHSAFFTITQAIFDYHSQQSKMLEMLHQVRISYA